MSNQTDDKTQENKSKATTIYCFQGTEDLLDNKDNKDKIKAVLFDLFNIKNVNFLFGA